MYVFVQILNKIISEISGKSFKIVQLPLPLCGV